jgi:haloacetate dehalogenase
VIAVDKLGAGGTASPADASGHTQEARTAHLRAFASTVGLDRFAVAGHSRGALEAAQLALDDPRVTSAVLFAGATLPPSDSALPPVPPASDALPEVAWIRARVEPLFADPESPIARAYLEGRLAWVRGDDHHPDRPYRADAIRRAIEAENTVFLPSASVARDDLLRRLAGRGLPVPVLLLWGADDAGAPVERALDLLRVLDAPGAAVQLRVVDRARHLLHHEFAALAAAAVRDHLAGNVPGVTEGTPA